MNKISHLLAAGLVAIGVSAQAEAVHTKYSDEYAIITIPVAEGDNLIGVSVAPASATDAAVSDLFTISGTDSVDVYTGSGYQNSNADELDLEISDYFWYNAEEAGTVYQFGKVTEAVAAGAQVSVTAGYGFVAAPFTDSWTVVGSELETVGGGSKKSTANKVYVWNGAGYTTYWYNNKSHAWKPSTPNAFAPGQAVVVQFADTTVTSLTVKPVAQ